MKVIYSYKKILLLKSLFLGYILGQKQELFASLSYLVSQQSLIQLDIYFNKSEIKKTCSLTETKFIRIAM